MPEREVIVAVARFCGKCGAALREDAPRCTQCGAEVGHPAGFVGQAEQEMMLGDRKSPGKVGFWRRLLARLIVLARLIGKVKRRGEV
jgi:uncharacterized membrane protein YvbJ